MEKFIIEISIKNKNLFTFEYYDLDKAQQDFSHFNYNIALGYPELITISLKGVYKYKSISQEIDTHVVTLEQADNSCK